MGKVIVKLLMILTLFMLNLYSSGLTKKELTKLAKVEVKVGDTLFLGEYPMGELNWYEAMKYCKSIGGRLPSVEEFESAYKEFTDKSEYFGTNRFWTSNERASSTTKAYYYYFGIHDFRWRNKRSVNYVRCVK